jgi:23S rRNA pseudoU1915 N3-methylase RlmH
MLVARHAHCRYRHWPPETGSGTELAERYRERFDDIGRKLGFRSLEIHEIPESRARDAAGRMADEAAAISALIPTNRPSLPSTSAAKPSTAPPCAASWTLARRIGSDCCFSDWRGGRTFA